MPVTGCATPAGTARYRDRFRSKAAGDHFRQQHDLFLSSIGIGTYLGNADSGTDKGYEEAVVRAVQLGANVIDTAANYRFQRSERSVGRALNVLEQQGFSRDEVVVCTKGGYLPFDGAPPQNLRAYVEETFVRPGIAQFTDIVGGAHCMTAAYLRNQLEQSLRNLSLECIDVYYIHNPESQLGYISREDFDMRLRAAFAELEGHRTEGTIGMYGVATWNGFRVSSQSREYHSLTRMVELAREVGGESQGFGFIQLPFNLAMPEALTLRNQILDEKQLSIVEAAAALGITVIASASILQGRVAQQLPDSIREPLGSLPTDVQTALQFARSAPGVTTALIGMSNSGHVEENLQLVAREPVSSRDFVRLFSE
ncbi:MAG TPA: aldo/keto reductase [Pyrinomonadaceae bacterium]|nr:aldo/keto reductase [Pyrinomonadaceae bacterium]